MKELRAALKGVKLAPKAVVGRVSLYLRQLESFQRQGYSTVSSNQLGEPLSIKNAQVRKDLAFFGQFGHPGIGYRIDELISALRQILGIDRDWPIVLVGLGNLGRGPAEVSWFPRADFTSWRSLTTIPARLASRKRGSRSSRSMPCARPWSRTRSVWASCACPPRRRSGWPIR